MGAVDPGSSRSGMAFELKQAFDRTFAEPARTDVLQSEDFLAIRLGDDPHVLPLADVARLLPLGALTRLPSAIPELLGIMSDARVVMPVYDLRALLGYPAGGSPRWMVIAAALPIGLAFETFDGQFRHQRDAGASPSGRESPPRSEREVLRIADRAWPVVQMASILTTLQSRVLDRAAQEREL